MTLNNSSANTDAESKPARTGKRPRTVKTELGVKYQKLIKPTVKK